MIAIFGAPGAGKSMQGRLLSRKYGWQWISARELFIGLHDKDVTQALNCGMTVEDEKSIAVLNSALNRADRNAILDGFPSSVSQIYWMIENNKLRDIQGAIVLRVPRGELWKRLVERKRVDDTRAAIERRQDLYERTITGMVRVLSMNGVEVREVNGCNEPEDVLERIEEVLGDWNIIAKKQFQNIGYR